MMETYSTYIISAVAFIIGLVVTHLFHIFTNKISKICYSISKTFLGGSGEDSTFGKVEVTYNSAPVQNLYMCNIILVNTSNKDFEDLVVTVWVGLNSIILTSRASKTGTINSLSLTREFYEEVSRKSKADEEIDLTKKPYRIPVFNRDDTITFSCLVTNDKGEEPNIYLDCDHPGLKVKANFIQPQLFWGENQTIAAWYGLTISAITSALVVICLQSKILIAIFVFILGAFCIIPGVLIMKLFRKFSKILR